MEINILLLIIAGLIGTIIYLIKTSSKSYIDYLFSKEIEQYKKELEKTSIQYQAKLNYNLNVTNDSYKATLDAYAKIFDAFDSYWKSISTTLNPGETDKGFEELKQIRKELSQKLVILDEEIYSKINTLIGNMMEITLQVSQKIKPDVNTLKNINKLTNEEIPNLIRKKFGLGNIPNELLGIDSTPPTEENQ